MYDCSKEFSTFYRKKVVLPAKEQNELREKRKLNIKRLKNGLSDYNDKKRQSYKISENRIQGSMAMHTITQNDEHDYDIDVGIVFESENLNELGPLATRNMVADALERETKQFAEKPEVKTSCVRLKYTSVGYHVDFAIFKRYKEYLWEDEYTYKHAGAEWSIRQLKGLEEWFTKEIKIKGDNLRKIIRLSKMFCKSRVSWKNMPSGLIQSILSDEQLATYYTRLDEAFYYTMKSILDRLKLSLDVEAPVDNRRQLVTRDIDYTRMTNWKNHLESNLKELDILFDSDCTHSDALGAWSTFFNHSYWENLKTSSTNKAFESVQDYNNTEQFIDELYPVYEQYDVSIDCKVSGDGFRVMSIFKYFDKFKKFIPHNFSIKCKIGDTNCPSYDKVLWKVLNVGSEAKRQNDIRGQIQNRGKEITETSNFFGPHYIECYLIKNQVCVGIGHVEVPIGHD